MSLGREQVIRGFHPGLLSGLAFSGANRPPSPDQDDGILTADEIASLSLDGVDLVVLSACETGLGEVAGGEGLLGVQRAFQVAGARSTVASFWQVEDVATRRLMERFYRNYWEEEMSKLDALRDAQLYLLNHPEAIRGDRPLRAQTNDEPKRLSPQFWAAFSLSGDWR
jgi:CHAT domain-containing protein